MLDHFDVSMIHPHRTASIRLGMLVLMAAIGALFVYKYGSRISVHAALYAGIYAVLFLAAGVVVWLRSGLSGGRVSAQLRLRSKGFLIVVALIVVAAVAITILLPGSGRLGRLPAIDIWLGRLLDGTFPYGPPGNPSGFPGLYLLAAPFYLLGIPEFMAVFGLCVFAGIVALGVPQQTERMAVMMTLAALPTTWYEVLLKSELLLNMVLVIGSLIAAERLLRNPERSSPSSKKSNAGRTLLVGVLFGFVLSTRLTVAVVYGMYLVWRFRSGARQGIVVAIVAVVVFFVPLPLFILWDRATFLEWGPFAVQSLYLPTYVVVAFGATGLFCAFVARNPSELLAFVGYVLFALTAVSFGYAIAEYGFVEAVMDGYDITYFIFCIPFFVISLSSFTFVRRPDEST